MNLKQRYNESVIDELGRIQSIRYMTEDELIKIGMQFEGESISDELDFNKGWAITTKHGNVGYVIPYLPGKGASFFIGYSFYKYLASPKFYIGGGVHKNSEKSKAIEQWEFRQNIKQHNPPSEFDKFIDTIL